MKSLFEQIGAASFSEMLETWAEFLTITNPPTAIYRGYYLNSAALDYSVDSLRHVDDYLELVRRHGFRPNEINTVVTRCGAYLGEVIRRANPATSCRWIAYEDAVRMERAVGKSPETIENFALLHIRDGLLCYPFAKVIKRLRFGGEDSVATFAKLNVSLQGLPKDQFDKFWGDIHSKVPGQNAITLGIVESPERKS